jgi:hypothetical protein
MKSQALLVGLVIVVFGVLVSLQRRAPAPSASEAIKEIPIIPVVPQQQVKQSDYSKLLMYNDDPTAGNDHLNELVEEGSPSLGDELCFIIFNPQCSTAWRNYCIQHLANYYIRYGGDKYFKKVLKAVDLEERELASTAIFNAARIMFISLNELTITSRALATHICALQRYVVLLLWS